MDVWIYGVLHESGRNYIVPRITNQAIYPTLLLACVKEILISRATAFAVMAMLVLVSPFGGIFPVLQLLMAL